MEQKRKIVEAENKLGGHCNKSGYEMQTSGTGEQSPDIKD